MRALIEPKLISGNANLPLANKISDYISGQSGRQISLVKANIERFSDKEVYVEVYENVRSEDMFIIQPTSSPANDNLMEILIIADALRRSSASRITAVIPYYGYARQDRRTKPRTPISAKLVANLLTEAGVSRVLTMDLHSAQIQGFFDIPVDNLYASPIFSLDIRSKLSKSEGNIVVVSPDVGGVERARELAKRINASLAVVDKRRSSTGDVTEMTVIGDVQGQVCIIVDDICDSGGTLCKAADLILSRGAQEVHAYVTHGVLSGNAFQRIQNSSLRNVVITDSIQHAKPVKEMDKVRTISAAPLLAQAILNIANGTSISSLFEAKTLDWLYARSPSAD